MKTICETNMTQQKAPLIVAYGGGANSTAMLIEMCRRGINPNLILFADTGGERPETYDHVHAVSGWSESRFGIPIVWVRKTFKGEPESLESDCLRKHMLPSIAYGYKSCSVKHKVEPQNKFCNSWGPAKLAWTAGLKCVKVIGYDAGEERRARIAEDDKYTFWYPLVEWGIHREDCLELCRSEGFTPAKSACFFCPSSKKHEIVKLSQDHPDLAARAIAMEENAHLTSIKGLGRSFSWKAFLAGESAAKEAAQPSEIPCGCYDGGDE